jgi:hypothetical protein
MWTRRAGRHDIAQTLERVEVELHVGNPAIGQHHPAMRRAALDADLREPRHPCGQRSVESVHVRAQLLDGRILRTDFPDLAAHGNRHPGRLHRSHELENVRADFHVEPLLLRQRAFRDVDEGGRVDVDVVEPRADGLANERLDGADLGTRGGRILLVVHLKVVTLDEQGTTKSLPQRRGEHHRHVLGGPLLRVRNLGPRDLHDERPGIHRARRAKDGPGGVVGRAADVDGRHGEAAHVAAPTSHVEILDGRRLHADRLPDLPQQPPRVLARDRLAEDGGASELVHLPARQHVGTSDIHGACRYGDRIAEESIQGVDVVHGVPRQMGIRGGGQVVSWKTRKVARRPRGGKAAARRRQGGGTSGSLSPDWPARRTKA